MTRRRKLTGRAADLAQIHIARKALAMPEPSYRAMLERLTRTPERPGKRSAADLDAAERAKVIDHFISLGWRPSRPRTRPHGAQAQRRRIARLLEAAGRPAAYAEAMAQRMYGRVLRFCAPAELRGIIAALEIDRQRRARRA